MIEKTCHHHANNRALGTKKGADFEWLTYADLWQLIGKTRTVLAQLGVGKDDKVAVISNNRWEWVTFLYGILQRGGTLVPMYEAMLEKDWQYIIQDSDSKVLIVATEKIYEQVKDYAGKVGKVQHVICLDAAEDKSYSYQHWLKKVANEAAAPANPVSEEDICTIIYTSGTTGKPKGVELTHANIVSSVSSQSDGRRSNKSSYIAVL